MENSNDKKYSFAIIVLILILGFVLGIVFNKYLYKNEVVDTTSNIEAVYNEIINNYYQDINKEELENAAIEGMMSILKDKHSEYLTKEEQETFNEYLGGKYYGIGIQMSKIDNSIVITRVFENSPAANQDLKAGDIIVKINSVNVTSFELDDVAKLIKNKSNPVKLEIVRDGKTKSFTIIPANVNIPSVYKEVFENGNKKIGYLALNIFAENTDEQFKQKLKELEKEGIDALIIDLRNNSGGRLDTVSNIIDMFLEKGTVMFELRKNDKVTKQYAKTKEKNSIKTAVLVNSLTASASEVLASALKEQNGAILVGVKTYGKGTAQETMTLSNGSLVKFTIEEWLTSKGESIDKMGITPDIEEALKEDYYKTLEYKDDNQLQKAISIISES